MFPSFRTPRSVLCLLAVALMVVAGFYSAAAPATPSAAGAHSGPTGRKMLSDARPSVVPAASLAEIPVGQGPDALSVDTANDTLFVANEYTNNVSEFSLDSNAYLGAVSVGSEPCAGCLALDAHNGTVYVANSGSNNVSAVSLGYGGVSATIPVGSFPDAILFDPANQNVYVANAGSGTLTVISTIINNVTLTIPVGPDPVALALDTKNGNVLVAVAGANNLTIISSVTNLPIATVTVGSDPDAVAYDGGNNEIYVANAGSDNVSVVGATNHTYDATVNVGSGPGALVVDPPKKEVFVANRFSGNVSVISTFYQVVVANITVGTQPGTDGAMLLNPKTGAVFVADGGSNNISILSAAPPAIAGDVSVLNIPEALAMNASNGRVYVANFGSANVSVFSVAKVTFHAGGLPSGSNWSVAAGTPSLFDYNVTYRSGGTIVFFEPNGSFPYTITPPSGFGVSHVGGPKGPSQTLANLTGRPASFRVQFGPLENLSINETGLPLGSAWSVGLVSGFAHGGAPSMNGSTNGTSIAFTVVKGPWKYTVLNRPSEFRPTHSKGTVHVGAKAASVILPFVLVGRKVVFLETGLPAGTAWTVNITGPVTETLNGTTSSLTAYLPNGTYTFVVGNFSTLHPNTGGTPHDQGTVTVVAPGVAIDERVAYSTSA